jgi:hypothetical protein
MLALCSETAALLDALPGIHLQYNVAGLRPYVIGGLTGTGLIAGISPIVALA